MIFHGWVHFTLSVESNKFHPHSKLYLLKLYAYLRVHVATWLLHTIVLLFALSCCDGI